MPEPLPPYTASRPLCSKCGHDTASTHYTGAGEACGLFSRLSAVDTLERLCRQCALCGYHWDETLATRDQAAPFRGRIPLGQQFTTDVVHVGRLSPGETELVVAHVPSGLHRKFVYPTRSGAEAGEGPLQMFQGLLDQVDAWQREPIEAAPPVVSQSHH